MTSLGSINRLVEPSGFHIIQTTTAAEPSWVNCATAPTDNQHQAEGLKYITECSRPAAVTASMAAARRQQPEESVYNWGQPAAAAAAGARAAAAAANSSRDTGAPRIKTYNVSAPPVAPARRMHEDSSQVGVSLLLHQLPLGS